MFLICYLLLWLATAVVLSASAIWLWRRVDRVLPP